MRCVVIGCLLLSTLAHAEVYRYTDSNGTVVLSRQGVPPHLVGKGYEVLNEQGRVIRVIDPPPTAEELQRRRDELAQAAEDLRLRQLYSNVKDLDAAREHKLRTLDAFVTVIAGNLELTREQIATLEASAGRQQRMGKEVDPDTLKQLEQLNTDRGRLEKELQHRRNLRDQINAEFDKDRSRLVQIYGLPAAQP